MKLPVASYSFLNTWEICPHQAARKYIVKDLPREPQTPEMTWGIEVHAAMEKRLRDKTPLPASMSTFEIWCVGLDKCHVEPERKLGVTAAGRPCDFFAPEVYLRGKLDAPVLLRTDAAAIIDWKTGKQREDPFELAIGALLLRASRPEITKLIGSYVWLKNRVKGKSHDVSNTGATWRQVRRTMLEVQGAIDAQTFRKTPGALCGWCPVKDCEHNRRKT